jgi:hypothetical protein
VNGNFGSVIKNASSNGSKTKKLKQEASSAKIAMELDGHLVLRKMAPARHAMVKSE